MHEGCYDLSGKIKNIQVHIIFSFFGGGSHATRGRGEVFEL